MKAQELLGRTVVDMDYGDSGVVTGAERRNVLVTFPGMREMWVCEGDLVPCDSWEQWSELTVNPPQGLMVILAKSLA